MTEDDPRFAHALRLAEALCFASPDPVPARRLASLLGDDGPDAETVFAVLAARTAAGGVVLAPVAGGWMFRTAPDLAPALARVVARPRRLPRAAMETLAIIAWDGPCTRAEIEDKRGVALHAATLDLLLTEALIRPAGRRDVPGRPGLWDVTAEFLARFGLGSRTDLPRRDEVIVGPDGSDEADAMLRSGTADAIDAVGKTYR